MHFGPGPVFVYEWLTASRRWQMYALRSLFVGMLLGALWLVWWSNGEDYERQGIRYLAQIGEQLYYAVIGTQLTLVLLAAPAATAGSICLDKARGALIHLLVTDLSNSEIILGKLFARLTPILGLIFCSVPVLFLASFMGGIDLGSLIGAYLVCIGVALLTCVLALALSVWGTKTHEVLLVTYGLIIATLLAYPIWDVINDVWSIGPLPDWVLHSNPYWMAFAPYARPGATEWSDYAVFLAGCLAISLVLLLVSILWVRWVIIWQSGKGATPSRKKKADKPRREPWFGPSLDRNPILWLEWHRKRPSRWMRIVWQIYIVSGILFTLLAIYYALEHGSMRSAFVPFLNGFLVAIGLLLVSVSSVTALAEERVRGTLDILLTTPLGTATIVWEKWWGVYRVVPLLVILPAITGGVLALREERLVEWILLIGLILAYGAGTTSLGMALATWVSRLGRAVTLSVAASVFINVGWLFLMIALFNRGNWGNWGPGMASAGPWFGTAFSTVLIEEHRVLEEGLSSWQVLWIAVYSATAILLLLATILTFDRCLGRVSERTR